MKVSTMAHLGTPKKNDIYIYKRLIGLNMAEKNHNKLCPYCRMRKGEYFSPRELGKMKPYCTSWECNQ